MVGYSLYGQTKDPDLHIHTPSEQTVPHFCLVPRRELASLTFHSVRFSNLTRGSQFCLWIPSSTSCILKGGLVPPGRTESSIALIAILPVITVRNKIGLHQNSCRGLAPGCCVGKNLSFGHRTLVNRLMYYLQTKPSSAPTLRVFSLQNNKPKIYL